MSLASYELCLLTSPVRSVLDQLRRMVSPLYRLHYSAVDCVEIHYSDARDALLIRLCFAQNFSDRTRQRGLAEDLEEKGFEVLESSELPAKDRPRFETVLRKQYDSRVQQYPSAASPSVVSKLIDSLAEHLESLDEAKAEESRAAQRRAQEIARERAAHEEALRREKDLAAKRAAEAEKMRAERERAAKAEARRIAEQERARDQAEREQVEELARQAALAVARDRAQRASTVLTPAPALAPPPLAPPPLAPPPLAPPPNTQARAPRMGTVDALDHLIEESVAGDMPSFEVDVEGSKDLLAALPAEVQREEPAEAEGRTAREDTFGSLDSMIDDLPVGPEAPEETTGARFPRASTEQVDGLLDALWPS